MKRYFLTLLATLATLCNLFGASPALAEDSSSGKNSKAAAKKDESSNKPNSEEEDIRKNHLKRFQKGYVELGGQVGWGYAVQIPPGAHRTDWEFAYLFPSLKYNLTGPIGDSFYRGTLSWVNELGIAKAYSPWNRTLIGYSPVMLQYKFLWPKVNWSPYVFGGGGFSWTDWNEARQRQIATNFEFLLHAGAGVEFYKTKEGAFSLNYRFFHISNAGIEFPNIGINANLFTIGYSF